MLITRTEVYQWCSVLVMCECVILFVCVSLSGCVALFLLVSVCGSGFVCVFVELERVCD